MIVIGYELVSYLLHHPSARCVTFKELFICMDILNKLTPYGLFKLTPIDNL